MAKTLSEIKATIKEAISEPGLDYLNICSEFEKLQDIDVEILKITTDQIDLLSSKAKEVILKYEKENDILTDKLFELSEKFSTINIEETKKYPEVYDYFNEIGKNIIDLCTFIENIKEVINEEIKKEEEDTEKKTSDTKLLEEKKSVLNIVEC